ncbi:unnamed protein product [Boreogadus saida]
MTTMQSRCEENKWEGGSAASAELQNSEASRRAFPDLQLNLRLRLRGSTNQLHQWISREASKRHFARARARGLSSPPSSLPGEGKRVCQTHAPLPQQRCMSGGSAVATQDG